MLIVGGDLMIIYKITNMINNKVYIGQTIHTLEHRKSRHIECVNTGVDRHLYNAMRKYGVENFVFEEIDHADNIDDLNYLESYYITKYDSVRKGYNMGYGGDNNVMFSDVVKSKHDAVMRSDEVRSKISQSMKNYRKTHPFSDEHRRKLSEKAMGNHNFGNGDTRSVPCYCIDKNFGRVDFKNFKEGGVWWFNHYHPFGDTYSESTFQRKIRECIIRGWCKYRFPNRTEIIINEDDIKWFKK